MTIFLTSSPGGHYFNGQGERAACELNRANSFVDNLKKCWKEKSRCLIVSANPDEFDRNDGMRNLFSESYHLTGMSISEIVTWDNRREEITKEQLHTYDVIILSGGHVPTQNQFFKKIGLKEKLEGFGGIIIGISAGTMNSAGTVYAQPELEGESIDSAYKRFITGLGLTDLTILPHYQDIRNTYLDGKRVMEDITYPDSLGREFYALVDGSYIVIEESGETTLHGEAYVVSDGELKKVCENGRYIKIKK